MLSRSVVAGSVALMLGVASSAIYPSLASAQRQLSYTSRADRSGAYYFGPAARRAYAAQYRAGTQAFATAPYRARVGRNLPYPDRPYGDPGKW